MAQDISQYEYWTDDDYASRSVVNSSGGDISMQVSTEQLSAGVHYFNFRACRSDGVWGNFYRYLYYIPTLKGSADGGVNVEYWLDDDLAGVKTQSANSGSMSLTLDISSLSSGVHYFNCTPVSATGERGSFERYMFYIPEANPNTNAQLSKAEYWLDDDYASKVTVQTSNIQQVYTIDISHLGPGVHYFNYRAFDNKGNAGSWIRELFYLAHAEQTAASDKIDYEYWIDDNTANKVTGSGTGSEYMFTIDVAGLSPGKHTFNFRAKNVLDQWSDVFTEEFEIADGSMTSVYKLPYVVDEANRQVFTPDGKLVRTPKKGVNIIRMSDGTVKKVIVK